MILGEPTFQAILEWIRAEGCPYCGEFPTEIFVDGPDDVHLNDCGHVIDVASLLDAGQ